MRRIRVPLSGSELEELQRKGVDDPFIAEVPYQASEDLPDTSYLARVGEAIYLFGRLEGRIVEGMAMLYEDRTVSQSGRLRDGSKDSIAKLRTRLWGKMSSGKKLKDAFGDIATDLRDLRHEDAASYSDAVISLLWSDDSGVEPLVDRRNILAHASYGTNRREGQRLFRRYVKTKSGSAESEVVCIDNQWLDGYINDLKSAHAELMSLSSHIYITVRTYDYLHEREGVAQKPLSDFMFYAPISD